MLNLTNASVLSYSQNSLFFGESFRYQNQKSLTVEGILRDVGNVDGVSGIQSGINNLFFTDEDYSSIIINGYNFGQGRITSISLPDGNDVRTKPYTINVTCYETGNLFNLSGTNYSGMAQSAQNRYDLLDNLSEDFSYNRNGESYGYTHNVSIKLNSGNGVTISPIEMAKIFAANLISGNTPFGFLTSGENQDIGFKTYNESYNSITNECSFSENYSRPTNNSGLMVTRTNNFSMNEDGISVVTENGSIKGGFSNGAISIGSNQNPVEFNKIIQLIDEISSGSFNRCSGSFSYYSTPGAYPIYTGYNVYSKNLNPFSKTAEYTISYSNDPKQISGCSWNYTNQITRNGRYYDLVENGNIIGHGAPQNEGYPKARTFYNTVRSGAYERNYTIYTGYIDTAALTLRRISESKTSSQFNGVVGYNFAFSDNPINNNDTNGVKTQEISVNDSIPTQLLNKFDLFNNGEIVQPQENSTLGNRSLDIQFSLTRNHNLSSVKNYAKTLANSYIPNGSDVFISSLSYTYNPIQKKFSLNAGWTFQRDAITNI